MNGPLRQRQRVIASLMLGMGILCVIGLWLFESHTGVIAEMDYYGYPFLLFIFCSGFATNFLAPSYRHHSITIVYAGVCLYFLAELFSFSVFQSETRLYTVANTLLWMPIIYVTAFVFFPRKIAVIATGCVFVLSLLPSVVILIFRGRAYWDVTVAALLINAYAAHLMTLLALSLVAALDNQFELASSKARTMESAALTDGLTGVANRRGIDEILASFELRSGPTLGLILFDVDNFKSVNDRFGHFTGDELLVYIAARIGEKLRDTDVLGRWGGEEFLVIAPGSSRSGVLLLAERIRQSVLDSPHPVVGVVTVSAGVTMWTGETTAREALTLADQALYRAKALGRNRVES